MARRRKISRYRVVTNRSAKVEKQPGLYERHFRKFAFGLIFIWILTRVFDFSLMPPSYQGLFITRPYYGLHSWANANRAWAARSHVKYGLGYTRGYRTLVVGDPPPPREVHFVKRISYCASRSVQSNGAREMTFLGRRSACEAGPTDFESVCLTILA